MAIGCAFVTAELAWLDRFITDSLKDYFADVYPAEPAGLPEPDDSPYGRLIRRNSLDVTDRVILSLALAPHLQPAILDPFLTRNPNTDRPFSEFGGHVPPHGGFEPNVETALFVLSGGQLDRRLAAMPRFDITAPLFRDGILVADTSPSSRSALRPAPGLVHEIATGDRGAPPMDASFPARPISTRMTWDDLVLPPQTRAEVEGIVTWTQAAPRLLQNATAARYLDRGVRALFTGPPGTGKTLTATLLGQRTGRPVFRVDLSLVVSKWVGETEKNLATLFNIAQGRDWILFFDEADSLFGRRSDGSQSNDRHANQEVAFLLQRIEAFDGLTILATNLKGQIEPAFLRRFQPIVRFAAPGPLERLQLWSRMISGSHLFEAGIDPAVLAEDYEMTGAVMVNVLRRALTSQTRHALPNIPETLLRATIERELAESGKVPLS